MISRGAIWCTIWLPLVMGLLFGSGRAGSFGCYEDLSGIETSAASKLGTALLTTSASEITASNAAVTFTSSATLMDSTQTDPAVVTGRSLIVTPPAATSTMITITAASRTTNLATITTTAKTTSTNAAARLHVPSLFQHLAVFAPCILEPWVALTAFVLLRTWGVDAMMADAHAEPDSARSISAVTGTLIVNATQTIFVAEPQFSIDGPSRYWPCTRVVGSFMPGAMFYFMIAMIGGFVGILLFGMSLVQEVTEGRGTRGSGRGIGRRDLKLGLKFLLPWFFLVTPGLAGAIGVGGNDGLAPLGTPSSTASTMVTVYGRAPHTKASATSVSGTADSTAVPTSASARPVFEPPPYHVPVGVWIAIGFGIVAALGNVALWYFKFRKHGDPKTQDVEGQEAQRSENTER